MVVNDFSATHIYTHTSVLWSICYAHPHTSFICLLFTTFFHLTLYFIYISVKKQFFFWRISHSLLETRVSEWKRERRGKWHREKWDDMRRLQPSWKKIYKHFCRHHTKKGTSFSYTHTKRQYDEENSKATHIDLFNFFWDFFLCHWFST